MTKFQITIFSILHAVGVLLIPLLITLLGGCLEIEKLQVPPPAACEDVQTSLNSAMEFTSNSLKVGDFVHTEESVAPLSNNPQVTADVIEKLVGVEPLGNNTFETRTLETIVTYNNGEQKQETKEDLGSAPNPYVLCPSDTPFHGLQVFHRTVPVTDFKDSCNGYPNCQIAITEVKFDIVAKMDDGRQEVRKFDFILSKEVPYIAKNLKSCMTGTINVNGQPVPVTQCSVVRNFGNQP